jgi:hypothetical protein
MLSVVLTRRGDSESLDENAAYYPDLSLFVFLLFVKSSFHGSVLFLVVKCWLNGRSLDECNGKSR